MKHVKLFEDFTNETSHLTKKSRAGLSKKETLKVAQKFADALTKLDGKEYTVSDDYEEDSFDNMKKLSLDHNLPFPYLIDETQEIARAYGAVCTPDFFGYNDKLGLQYRGRLDESRKESVDGAKRELFEAMKQISITGKGPDNQIPSMGCSIKWFE